MRLGSILITFLCFIGIVSAQKEHFSYLDLYDLEYVSDPQISPSGNWIVYRRMGFNIMEDRVEGALWMIQKDGSQHQKLTSNEHNEFSPVWSPNGDRIAFVASTEEGAEIYMYWVNTAKMAKISQLPFSPSALTWSPKGDQLAFAMNVEKAPPVLAKMPKKPKGAKWAQAPRITDRLRHEADGRGYIKPGFSHLFVIPADGGAPRQITSGDYNHNGSLSFTPDGNQIYFGANRDADWEYNFRNSRIYKVGVNDGAIVAITKGKTSYGNPKVSPDGTQLAYVGFEDKVQDYQVRRLIVSKLDGSAPKIISKELDRGVYNINWDAKSAGLFCSYDDKGNSKIAHISLSGKENKLANDMGGTSIGRPYAGGSYSVAKDGTIAFTQSRPSYPAALAVVGSKAKTPKKITALNAALFKFRTLGKVEEVWYTSSFDQRKIQGWVVYPPDYDANKKYPFLVENHGGPILNYGDRFSAEIQLYAAAGYIVFYPNPRGSTSYGEAFGNLLKNNYPGDDYTDVMDGVDYCIEKGIAHEDQLFVTGGSAGGIMSAWMIGKNNRFEAAVVAKPVMNWISKTLVADNYFAYKDYRYPGHPWENFEGYWKFSPISLVGK